MVRASRGGGPLSFVVVVFRFRELPADLAARIQRRRVHIDVRNARADGGEDLGELTSHDLSPSWPRVLEFNSISTGRPSNAVQRKHPAPDLNEEQP